MNMNNIGKNVSDILQLYEFSMSIGRSFDYRENCDALLKLIMARKDLHSSWIYSYHGGGCHISYSIPRAPRDFYLQDCDKSMLQEIHEKNSMISLPVNEEIRRTVPFQLQGGCVAIFNLQEEGLLFLHSNRKQSFSDVELNQLEPIVTKFRKSLEVSRVYEKREHILRSLENQNKELSEYAQMVSHDLKSPIRNIETMVNWIKSDHSEQLNSGDIRTLDLISTNLERMDGLIDGILRYSTADKPGNESREVNLNDMVSDVVGAFDVPENIEVLIKNSLPTISGDKRKLRQLFGNLLDNAIKFNDKPKGLIEIGSKKIKEGYEFHIKDNGPGIDMTFKDKVFELFQRLDGESNSTGIGLSIAKKIVSFYRGHIWLESEPGQGATFYFTIHEESRA